MAKPSRPGQGERRICLPRDYTVVDTETTGLSTESCGLIEVSALRVRGGQVVEEFSTLIRPPWRQVLRDGEWREGYVDDFIQGLTGITDEMLEGAPLPIEALPLVRDFLEEDLLLGHNVRFDAAFLYDSFRKYLNCPLKNDTLDQLAISRKLLPDLPHHRLGDVAAALGVPYEGAHRALALSRGTEEDFQRLFEKKKPPKPRYPGVPGHPFCKKLVVLTGSLATPEHADRVARAGGRVEKEVTAKTDFLAVPAPGDKPLPGKNGGPAILPQGAFLRLLGEAESSAH